MTHSARRAPVLAAILEFNAQRKPKRVRLKLQRMDLDSFSFFRGTDHLFGAAWHEFKPPDVGPAVLLCGDLHLENFGAYQTDSGDFLYDINDFDEALVAPCTVDLVRCATSILLAAELWSLTPLQTTGMVLSFLDNYRAAVTTTPAAADQGAAAPHAGRGPIWELLGEAALMHQVALLDHQTERLKGDARTIIRSKLKHPPVSAKRAAEVRAAVEAYAADRPRPETYRVLDVTGRIAGIGSLGVRRYLVLIAGGGTPDTNRLLDVKEALPSSLVGGFHAEQPDYEGNEALRVVTAQRTLQARATAGLDVLTIADEAFRMRELVPDDNRTSLSRFQHEPGKLRSAVEVAGQLTGWSHLRGARFVTKKNHATALVRWSSGPALDSVFVAAARCAERTRLDYEQFHAARADPDQLPKRLRSKPPVPRARRRER